MTTRFTEEWLRDALATGQVREVGKDGTRLQRAYRQHQRGAGPRAAPAPRENLQEVPGEAPGVSQESERSFMDRIRILVKQHGWLCYHTYRSDRSEPGYPDLTLCNGARLIFAEVKTNTGKLTKEQAVWIDLLRHTGKVEVYVWRPDDWSTIAACLT